MRLEDRAGLDSSMRAALVARVARHVTLEDVVRDDPRPAIAGVITQDEFTHDVLVRAGALCLVYDTT